ncbi:MAG: hemerythrin domain-containing protein [Myxococcales bacterium]
MTSAAPPGHPIDLLLEDHRRIREAIGAALRLAGGEGGVAATQAGARRVLEFFDAAWRRHELDEGDVLAPALAAQGLSAQTRQELRLALQFHRHLTEQVQRLAPLWAALAKDGASLATLGPRLDRRTRSLAATFNEHFLVEESLVFPDARALLDRSPETLEAVRQALLARRAVGQPAPPSS